MAGTFDVAIIGGGINGCGIARDAAGRVQWNAELVHDYVLFMANTGRRPDEAKNLQHRHVTVVQDRDTEERILEIEVRPSASARA